METEAFFDKWWGLTQSEVARTAYGGWKERIVEGEHRWVVKYNAGHWEKKRGGRHAPVKAEVVAPFDGEKFNFTKVKEEEVIGWVEEDGGIVHGAASAAPAAVVLFNVSPMFLGHSLIVPRPENCYPQVLRADGLKLVLKFIKKLPRKTSTGRIVYNSLGGFASVNHLHFHYLSQQFPVESHTTLGSIPLNTTFSTLPTYPTTVLTTSTDTPPCLIMGLLQFLLTEDIPYNMLLSPQRMYVFPRKNQVYNVGQYRMAVAEVSGCPIVQSEGEFEGITNDGYAQCMEDEIRVEGATWEKIVGYLSGK